MIEAVEAVKIFDVEAPKRIAAGRGMAAQRRRPRADASSGCTVTGSSTVTYVRSRRTLPLPLALGHRCVTLVPVEL